MNEELVAGTTATAEPSVYPPGLVEMVQAELLRELAERSVGIEERVREQLAAEMLEMTPPEFREIVNNLKPWKGEGHPPNLLMRICAAMGEIETIPKSAIHSQHGYPYSTVDDVIGACRPLLAKHMIWPNMRVVNRDFEAFNTTKGVGYNGNMTYACSLFNAVDPSDNVTWEMAGMVTNPGEKLDWVAQSQFLKYFLLLALCLERGNEDAESNPSDGPRDKSEALQRRRQQPQQRREHSDRPPVAPPPPPPAGNGNGSGPAGSNGSGASMTQLERWDNAWKRILETVNSTTPDTPALTQGSMAQLEIDAAERGWGKDMLEVTIRRELRWGYSRSLLELPWTISDRIAWMFKTFPADRFFNPPTEEETAPGGILHKQPEQQVLVAVPDGKAKKG